MSTAADEWEAARYAQRRVRAAVNPFGEARGIGLALVLTVLTGAGMWVAALLARDEPLALRDGSALFVDDGRILVLDDGIAYPAANATSALLLSDDAQAVSARDVADFPAGPPRGIPGALSTLPAASALSGSWQLCSNGDGTQTLILAASPYLPPPLGDALLLSDGAQSFVVAGGVRGDAADYSSGPAAAEAPLAHAVTQSVLALIEPSSGPVPATRWAPPAAIVCAQSDPGAPVAVPSPSAWGTRRIDQAPRNAHTTIVAPPGTGLLIARSAGGYWLLASTGELAPIADDAALHALGYERGDAVAAPEALVAELAPGPELSLEAARTELIGEQP